MYRFYVLMAMFLWFGLVQTPQARAQQARIDGRIVDAEGAPLYPVNVVLLYAADSTLARGGITDEDGTFSFQNLGAATYRVQVSLIGYETYNTEPIELTLGQALTLTDITLNEDLLLLDQVEVNAERELIEVQPDKTVLNVQGSINSTGSTALELLRKAPGVVVDNNDNIILSGKNGVKIYIDGKPSPLSTADLATQLRNMQASEIDAIEIITNPSARYEAEGNAGIINIRLRRDKSLGVNSTADLGYSYGNRAKYNANTTFNYRTPSQNTFGSYAFSGGESESWLNLYRIQNNILFDEQTTSVNTGPSNRMRIGSDLFLDESTILGVLFNGYIIDRNWTNQGLTPITDLETSQTVSVLDARSANDGVRRNGSANLNFRKDNRQGITTNLDLDLRWYHNGTVTNQPNFYRPALDAPPDEERIFSSLAPTDIQIYAFTADHERPFARGSLGIGTKLSTVLTDNVYTFYNLEEGVDVLDIERSNDFLFRESIGAGYATYSGAWAGFQVNVGVRAEATFSRGELTAFKQTDNNIVERSYLNFFPSGGLTYQAGPLHQVRLNYSRRIDRPSYQALNPFEFKLSELSYSRGNPFLRPQYTHSVSLSHTYRYVLNTSLTFSYTNDFFANISDSTEVSRTFLETINLDDQRVLSASVSYPYSPRPWWSTYTSVTGYNTRNRADLGQGRLIDVQATVASLYHQSNFKLPADWSLEASGWFSSPSIWGAVYKTDTNYSIDLGVRKKIFKGRGDVKVALTDVFNTAPWRGVQDFAGFYVDASGGWESRQLRINFSYLFGNDQVKKARNRKTGADAEGNRVN